MSKRSAAFQGRKEDPELDRDGPEDTAKKADGKTMSNRKIINPKSRRRPGGGDLSSLGNPFAPVDPNVAAASPAPANNNANPFANFGNNAQSQSFPAPNFGSNMQNSAPQNSSFPPSQNSSGNIFGNMNGGSSAFTFGNSNNSDHAANNPFAKAAQQSPAPASIPKFNLFQSAQPNTPVQASNLFGQSTNQNSQSSTNVFSQGASATTNHDQQNQEAPSGDMDMISPPSANKQSNPLGLTGQSTLNASDTASAAKPNIFGGFGATSSTSSTNGSQPTGALFGANNSETSENATSTPANTFNGANKLRTGTTASNSTQSNPFANFKPSAANTSSMSTSSNPFGSFPTEKPSESAASSSQSSILFPPQPSPNKTAESTPTTPASTSNLFGAPPQTSQFLFSTASTPPFGQSQSSLKPTSEGNGNLFTNARGSSRQNNDLEASNSTGNSFFGSQRGSGFGSSTSGNLSSTMAENELKRLRQRMNSNLRQLFLRLDTRTDWTNMISDILDAYKSAAARIAPVTDYPQTGFGSPLGAKRKQQADPTEDTPRAFKQPNTSAATPKATSSSTQPGSETSNLFKSIIGDANDSTQNSNHDTPQPSLFGAPPNTNNIFGNANGNTSNLFGTQASDGRFNAPKTSSSNIFGHVADTNPGDDHDDEGSEEGDSNEDTTRSNSFAPAKGGSLFDRITGGPPSKQNPIDGAESENGSAVGDQSEHDEGDHTWTPEKPIHFGASVKSTSTPNVNGENTLFGTATKPSGGLFNFSSSSTGSSLKPPENNILGSKLPATNQSSRATTPGTDVNGVSASEAEGEPSAQDKEITNGEVMEDKTSLTAQELKNEDVLYEVPKVKMMQFGPKAGKEDEKEWKSRGTGPFRVLKNKSTGRVRILHRIAPRGTVLVNSSLPQHALYKKLASKGTLSIGATGGVEGKKTMTFQQWTARMASDAAADGLLKVLQDNKEKA